MASNPVPSFDSEFNDGSIDLSGNGQWQVNMPWANASGMNQVAGDLATFSVNPNYGPTAAANPFSVASGVLSIGEHPIPSSVNPADVGNKPLAGGTLTTAQSHSQLYGYFEARMELPAGQGAGSAFWLLPSDGSWPPELDVEESLGQDPSTVYQTIHPTGGANIEQTYAAVPGGNFATGFHNYGVDWEADKITFYVDGKQTGQYDTPAGMHIPMYMILSSQAGNANNNWLGPVNGSTPASNAVKVDYVRAYASMPDLSSGGSPTPGGTVTAPAAPPVVAQPAPTPSVPPVSMPATPPTVGSGVDTLVLNLSEDAYLGDAQFSVAVDGTPLGAIQSATASHGQGQTQAFTFKGSFGTGPHTVGVSFLNDRWDGSGATDRNLYIDSATFNGAKAQGAAVLAGNGTVSFAVTGSAAAPVPVSLPVALATDTLQLSLAEDAWQGDAQAVITVDGKTVGGTVAVTALHAQGKSQSVVLTGQWGAGAHDIGIQFINDAYGGTPTTDRNLYVNGVTYDGQASATPSAALYSSGTAHAATATSPLVLQLSEDAYLGDAQFSVAVDGKSLGAAQSVTALHGSGAVQDFAFGQAMAVGTHDVAVSFLNDAWGGTASTDRNLYVNGVVANGATMPGSAATMLSAGTQHLTIVVAAHA